MSRWMRINLVLALLAGALLIIDRWPVPTGTRADRLTTLAVATIDRVRVERDGREVLALVRDGHGWRLSHPTKGPANTSRVAQLLAVADADVAFRFPAAGRDAEFGLARPAAMLQLDDTRLLFGDRDPTQRARYVRVDDSICVIDELYFHLLSLPATHFAGP